MPVSPIASLENRLHSITAQCLLQTLSLLPHVSGTLDVGGLCMVVILCSCVTELSTSCVWVCAPEAGGCVVKCPHQRTLLSVHLPTSDHPWKSETVVSSEFHCLVMNSHGVDREHRGKVTWQWKAFSTGLSWLSGVVDPGGTASVNLWRGFHLLPVTVCVWLEPLPTRDQGSSESQARDRKREASRNAERRVVNMEKQTLGFPEAPGHATPLW